MYDRYHDTYPYVPYDMYHDTYVPLLNSTSYMIRIMIPVYADLTSLFLSESYSICFRYCVCMCYLLFFICFPPEAIFRSNYWSLSCHHGLRCCINVLLII